MSLEGDRVITRVRLKNWKSHLETSLELGDGTNVLVGTMGAGKSAMLDAITYALFGTLPAVQSRRIKLDDLIMNKPRVMDRAEVEVGFLAPDGEEYIVKRVIERGSGTVLSELRRASGELIESPSSTRVSEEIQSRLKLDYDLFERAIYSEQDKLDYFLTLRRGERMERIDELLGIDKLEVVRKNVGPLMNRVEDRMEERKRTAAQLRQDSSISLLPAHEEEFHKLTAYMENIQRDLKQLQPKLDDVSTQLQRLREKKEKIDQLEKTSHQVDGAISMLRNRLEQIMSRLGEAVGIPLEEFRRRVADLERVYAGLEARTNELNLRFASLTSRVGRLEAEEGMLQNRLEKLGGELKKKRELANELKGLKLKELTELVKELERGVREVGDELAACRTRMQDLQQVLGGLSVAGTTCPVCESPLDESKRQELLEKRMAQLERQSELEAKLNARLKELSDELTRNMELQKRVMLLEIEVETVPKLEAEYQELSERLRAIGVELKSTRPEIDRLNGELEKIREEMNRVLEQLNEGRQLLQLRSDLDKVEFDLRSKQAEGLRIQHELWQLRRTYDEAKEKELEKLQMELIRSQERLQTELTSKEPLIEEKRKLIASIKEKLQMLSHCETEVKHLEDAVRALTAFQTALSRTQTALRREFIDGVNEAMSELWGSIYPYGDFTGVRLAVEGGERGGDYVLQLRDRAGNWVSVEGTASGGEKTDACLALRIAFAIVLAPSLSWIVLDEPTHNLDEEGIQELARVLRERIPDVVRQILIITHEQKLEEAVSGYLYRFSRNKDADEPTKVEMITVPGKIMS